MSALHVISDEIICIAFYIFCIILSSTNCSAIMAAKLDFTGEAAVAIAEMFFLALETL